jgi:hypothetical protein
MVICLPFTFILHWYHMSTTILWQICQLVGQPEHSNHQNTETNFRIQNIGEIDIVPNLQNSFCTSDQHLTKLYLITDANDFNYKLIVWNCIKLRWFHFTVFMIFPFTFLPENSSLWLSLHWDCIDKAVIHHLTQYPYMKVLTQVYIASWWSCAKKDDTSMKRWLMNHDVL